MNKVKPTINWPRYLRDLFANQRGRLVVLFGLMLLTGFVNGINILVLIPLLQLVGIDANAGGVVGNIGNCFELLGIPKTLFVVLSFFCVLSASYALLVRWRNVMSARVQQHFTVATQNSLFKAIVRSEWVFFMNTRGADFFHSLTKGIQQVASGTTFVLRFATTTLFVLVNVVLALLISPWMTLITLACAGLIGLYISRHHRMATETGRQLTELNQDFYSQVSDQLAGLKESKCFGTERQQMELFAAATTAIEEAHVDFSRTRENTVAVHSLFSVGLLALLLVLAIEVLQISLLEMSILVLLFARLLPRIQDMHTSFQQIVHLWPAYNRLIELQDQCDSHREDSAGDDGSLEPLKESIALRDVAFRYNENENWILRDINLRIAANTTTAIVGPSGAGKSTIAEILMGLLSPEKGSLEVDNQSLDKKQLVNWRHQIGYVPQETFLFHESIDQNLRWANPDATAGDIDAALEKAAAKQFVDELPEGRETQVGDRGTRLSGGERQRISLARALLRKPSILILDEATSSLDSENQDRIHKAIQQLHGDLTIVVIAHRLSTLHTADHIVVMDEGRIVEQGTIEKLSAIPNGRLQQLIEADHLAGI